jgi:chromosomal replication initiation ATPase DnaA
MLPDLKSRLLAAPTAAVGSPDEQTMAVVLTKLFSDRQIFVPQDVVQFILSRIERSFAAMRDVADAVDRRALAEKRAVTIPFVREILQAQGLLL